MSELPETVFEGRRYSGVVVRHGMLQSLKELIATVDGLSFASVAKARGNSPVSTYSGNWRRRQNLYPYGSVLRNESRPSGADGLYTHRCFLAEVKSVSAGGTPVFILASPHIRVVGAWAAHLGEVLGNPRPQYAAPRLEPLFEALKETATPFRATQITLQMPSDVDLEKVALTGKSPLISSLRATLAPVARPYAVRLEVPREPRPLRLHMDRHGNYWWHQANTDAFRVAASALAMLIADGYMSWTRDLPNRRIGTDDIFDRD